MTSFHETFINAIHTKTVLKVTMNSKEKGLIVRTCAPLDYGPQKKFKDKSNRYMFYHFETKHPSPMLPEQIRGIELINEHFDPGDIVTWNPPYDWHIARDWGVYS